MYTLPCSSGLRAQRTGRVRVGWGGLDLLLRGPDTQNIGNIPYTAYSQLGEHSCAGSDSVDNSLAARPQVPRLYLKLIEIK